MPSPSFLLTKPGGRSIVRPRPAIEPRAWQSQLIQVLRLRLKTTSPGGQDVLVHAGPGAGKTLGALLAFEQLQREHRLERFVVFCHRSSIARQWLQAAQRLGLVLREWEGDDPADGDDGLLLSYQVAARQRQRLLEVFAPDVGPGELDRRPNRPRWLAIADEVHHLGVDPEEPEASAWGYAFTSLTAACSLRLGLSGTPFRADNLAFCAARRIRSQESGEAIERIVPDLCVESRQLILAGDVRPLAFRFQDGWVDHGRGGHPHTTAVETSPLSAETRESWRSRNLRRAIRLGDEGGIAMRVLLQARCCLERLQQEHPGAGGLVIARDINHARGVTDLLREQGDQVHLVHSQDPEATGHLSAFRDGAGDWLVSIDMCAEGFDAPRLRVVAYLTTVVTRCRFVQAITRAVRMDAERALLEPVPRQVSYVFAPADPLLISHARGWSLSEPYVIRPRAAQEPGAAASPGVGSDSRPLQALADGAGSVLRLGGPELPGFLARGA